ncbi:MAG: TetR/AcrR family transcriptional regulator [Thermoleophilaceae bacterium]|nr:TetR/AcrR family transcriptional regulator [Thermoleophilaceae bacterium]
MTTSTSTRLPPKTERRALIIEAAVSEFAARGPAAVTMDDVATAAGLTKPRVYDIFAGKEDLLAAAVEGEADRFLGTVLSAYRSAFGNADAEVEALARAAIDYANERPDGVRLLRSPAANESEQVRAVQRRAHDVLAEAVAARIRFWMDADVGRAADLLAEMLLGMTLASIDHRLATGSPVDADLAELHAAAALAVLRNVDPALLLRLERES